LREALRGEVITEPLAAELTEHTGVCSGKRTATSHGDISRDDRGAGEPMAA
jgi:hypothetical protein